MLQRIKISQRVAINDDDIGRLARFQAAQHVAQLVDRGGDYCRAAQGVVIVALDAELDHELELGRDHIMPDDRAAGIGAEGDGYASLRLPFTKPIKAFAAGLTASLGARRSSIRAGRIGERVRAAIASRAGRRW